MANSVVQVEKNELFGKARWELVPRFVLIEAPSGVGYQNSIVVMNGDDDATFNRGFSRVEADAEVGDGLRVHPALGKVGVMQIDVPECKGQRLVTLPGVGMRGCVERFSSRNNRSLERRPGRHRKPLLKLERRVTDRAALHGSHEIE